MRDVNRSPWLLTTLGSVLWRSQSTAELESLRPMLMNAVLFFVSVGAVLNLISVPFVPRSEVLVRLGISAAIFCSVPAVRYIERRWSTRTASIVLILTLWGVASFPVLFRGVHSAAYSAYLLIIVLGVTLLGNRGGFLLVVASSILGAVTVYLEQIDLIDPTRLDPLMLWSAHFLFALVTVAVVSLAYHLTASAFEQRRQSEEQLTQSNYLLSKGAAALNQTNRAYQLLSACNQTITRATSLEALLNTVCLNLVTIGGYQIGLIAMVNKETQTLSISAHAGNLNLVTDQYGAQHLFEADPEIRSQVEIVLTTGLPVTFLWKKPGATKSAQAGTTVFCGLFPLMKADKPAGVLLVQQDQDDHFSAEEIKLLSDVTNDIAYGITALQSVQNLKEESGRLQMSNELLTATLASIDHAVFVIEGEERIVRMCNAAVEQIFGYKPEELIGRPVSVLHHSQESYQDFLHSRPTQLPHGSSYRTKLTTCHRDGGQRFTEVTLTPLRQSVSMLPGEVSVVRDVTEEHRMDEQLKASEANYRDLFNSMREGFALHEVVYDEAGQAIDYRFLEVNPAFETLTGIKCEDVVGKTVYTVFPATDPAVVAAMAKVVETGEPLCSEQFVPDLGKYFDFTAFRPRLGQFVLTFHDTTDRRVAQHALEEERALLAQRVAERTAALTQANAELAETARHKDEFLASVSHELRTPLNAILGITEAMSEEIYGPLNDTQHQKLHNIEESGHHLLVLINEVLDMAKIESGTLELEIENVSIRMICEASLRLTRQAATQKRIHVDLQIDSSINVIEADGRRLKQMLINLLGNAIKFTPQDKEIGLRVSSDGQQGVVHFTVWDTGIGIAPEQQKRLFKPFVQIDSKLTRQYNGTGLGLALVDKMAQLHGGTVALKSELGHGSEFTITLPIKINRISVPADENQEAESVYTLVPDPAIKEVDAPALQAPVVALSVLVADENKARAQAIAVYLADRGYNVQSVHDHIETLDTVQKQYYHLLVIDLQTSNSAGVETIHQIRAESRCRFSPIVALTDQPTLEERQQCQHVGATAYLDRAGQSESFFEAFDELLQEELLS